MSIKPKYAEAILNGTKKYEFRRRFPDNLYGTKIIIYATFPVKKIIGEFMIGRICEITSSDVLGFEERGITQQDCGISYTNLKEYLYPGSCKMINVMEPKRYTKSKSLSDFGLTRPPQSWQYLQNGN